MKRYLLEDLVYLLEEIAGYYVAEADKTKLKLMFSLGYKITSYTWEQVCLRGDLKLLKWLYKKDLQINGMPSWDENVYDTIISNIEDNYFEDRDTDEQYKILKWLCEEKCAANTILCNFSRNPSCVDARQWIHDNTTMACHEEDCLWSI